MAYWEFLLQKEGDRDWLPLETAHVEISEGRYRIIAHTSYCKTPVEIHLSQLLIDPPKRKIRKRAGQTTENGLMVVIPFTHLTAGSWTVRCAGTLPEAEAGSWEYGVQLQVLSVESGLDYWDSDLEEAPPATGLAGTSPATSRLQLPITGNQTKVNSSDPIATLGTTVPKPLATRPPSTTRDDGASAVNPIASTRGIPSLDAVSVEDLPLRLQLQHQAIVAQPQTPLSLQGQVTTFSQVDGLPSEGTLWIQLRNPETGNIVHREARSLSLTSVPSRFDLPVSLPAGLKGRLLVGELSLWTETSPPQVLAIQGFTVTLNLDALLESVANQGEHSTDSVFEDLAPAPSASSVASSDTRATATAQTPPSLSPRSIPFQRLYLPSAGLTLPPVIYRPMDSKTLGAPSLPVLANQSPRRRTAAAAPTRPAKPLSLPPIGNTVTSIRNRPTADSQTDSNRASLDLPPVAASEPADSEAATGTDMAPESLSDTSDREPKIREFQPDFQGRFWSRLSALAHEAQKAAADLKAQMEAAGVQAHSDDASPSSLPALSPSEEADPAPTVSAPVSHEVVVYEAEAEVTLAPQPAETELVDTLATDSLIAEDSEEAVPDEIPVPQLSLPEGELIAGSPLPITIRLPLHPRRLTVKVWLTDLQSRSLVDRPRWLMNWTPNSEGEQTTLLQLQVPFGSVEVQFEAIAIDLTTQRESYKTTLVRSIVPADLPEVDMTEPL
ncbi:MAG: hypothetical protein AAFQ89_09240 [Cyanobacteria bacterium J06626_18]